MLSPQISWSPCLCMLFMYQSQVCWHQPFREDMGCSYRVHLHLHHSIWGTTGRERIFYHSFWLFTKGEGGMAWGTLPGDFHMGWDSSRAVSSTHCHIWDLWNRGLEPCTQLQHSRFMPCAQLKAMLVLNCTYLSCQGTAELSWHCTLDHFVPMSRKILINLYYSVLLVQ